MKIFNIVLLVIFSGFVSIHASDNQKTIPFSDRQFEKSVTIEKILDRIEESRGSFNDSIQNLKVQQTTMLKSTVMGMMIIVKQIHFKRPDIIEQIEIKREENLCSGVNMKLDEHISHTLFTESLLSSLSPDDYHIHLIGKKTLNGRSAYLLKVKPINKKENLLKGKLWIDTKDFTLIRYEGEPLKLDNNSNGSGGKQLIEYAKINDKYWLPVLNRTKATWLLAIKLVNEMTYSGYEINAE
ncbi:hypothetical protein JW835_01435 [bacterium]|nr:hypothetical protein [bacterium]